MGLMRQLSTDGKTLTISVDEKFDFAKVKDFRASYASTDPDVQTIVVDLACTEYMDSSALGMLLNMQKNVAEHVKNFKIINCRPQVGKILKISRFDKKFEIA